MNTVKSRLFKKYSKRRKSRGHWVATYQCKKIIKMCNSVGAGVHKVGKIISFWPNFGPYFTDI